MTQSRLSDREMAQVRDANAAGAQPIVFIHGLWLLAEAWDLWRTHFEALGFATVAVDWPGDLGSVDEARHRPDAVANTRISEVVDHVSEVVAELQRKPIIVGHSIGGVVAQILAGRGLAAATVAIDPAPSRGVLPMPLSTIRVSFPVVGNPFNFKRAVTLTPRQFRYGFTNAISEEESLELYTRHHVAGSARALFQVATANIHHSTDARADTRSADRGPLLVISGGADKIVPPAISRSAYKRQARNTDNVTTHVEIPGVGHSLVFDHNWPTVAAAVQKFVSDQGINAR